MANRKQCAYCGSTDRKLTKEHLWPQALHQRLQKARGDDQHLFWLSRLDKEIKTEPQLRDICHVCNNGVLSQLDEYICKLWDQCFSKIHEFGSFVSFSYDYNLLCRWLLKLCYNSARIHKFDEFIYPPLAPYILNGSEPAAEFRLFLEIIPPGLISIAELKKMGMPSDKPLRWEPDYHRLGHAQFTASDGRKKILRAVHLRSYCFSIAFFEPGAKEAEINEFLSIFLLQKQDVKYIPPGSTAVSLMCNGVNAWDSLRGSRRKFVSDEGTAER